MSRNNESSLGGNTCFYKVTNKEIYDKLEHIDKKLSKINLKANVNSAIIGVIVVILVTILSQIN